MGTWDELCLPHPVGAKGAQHAGTTCLPWKVLRSQGRRDFMTQVCEEGRAGHKGLEITCSLLRIIKSMASIWEVSWG